ncbi:Protein Dr1 [Dirofilaria immitis]
MISFSKHRYFSDCLEHKLHKSCQASRNTKHWQATVGTNKDHRSSNYRQIMGDEDNEVGLPQKGLNMIIKDVIPDMRVANESRELLNACCVEFVRHVSREAQRISADDQRKTIYHEHVQKALVNLAFPYDYVEAADSVLNECKIAAENKLKRKNSRLDKCGIPEDQLYLMQQKLIEKARQEQLEAEAAELNRLQEENRGMQRSLSELLSKDEDDEDYDTA